MRSVLLTLVLLSLVLASCTVPGPSEPVAQIKSRQNQWRQKNIRRYRIAVLKIQSIFHAQTNTLVVEDGKVVEQSATCIPAPYEGRECKIQEFDPNEFTVEGLFNTALKYAPESASTKLVVTFDDTYHFPTTISRDNEIAIDDEAFWRVESFEPLE
jgi:hypothetical protein